MEQNISLRENTEQYLADLKAWIAEEEEKRPEEMAAFFAKRIESYEDVHLGSWAEEYGQIADYFDEGLGSLLDIGCGTGLELHAIYRRFPGVKVTGIDLSEEMLNRLRLTFAEHEIELIRGDYFSLPLGEERYDAALSFETLHHFPAEKRRKFTKSCTAPSDPADIISNAITPPAAAKKSGSVSLTAAASSENTESPTTKCCTLTFRRPVNIQRSF